MKTTRLLLLSLALSTSVLIPLNGRAQSAYTWSGVPGGSWTTPSNWTATSGAGGSYPGSGDTAILDNVPSGSSNVIYAYTTSAAASTNALGSLIINQSTAGVTNMLDLQTSLSIASNVTLSASAGTSLLYFDTYQASAVATAAASGTPTSVTALTLSIGGGAGTLTVGSGGVFEFGSSQSAVTAAAAPVLNGNVAINGGTLNVDRGKVNFVAYSETVNGTLSMSSGTIALGTVPSASGASSGLAQDTRLVVAGNFAAAGGSITTSLAKGYTTLYLMGATNDLSGLSSISTNITVSLAGSTTNSLSSLNQSLSIGSNTIGSLQLRNTNSVTTTVKTVSSTGGTIGAITFDGHTTGGNVTLLLGSNLTLTAGAAMPGNSGSQQTGTEVYTIDTGSGYTLDLSAGAGGAVLMPLNQYLTGAGAVTAVNWVMQGSGTIKAGAFDISQTKTSSVSGSVTLNAVGGNGSANNLGNYGNNTTASSGMTTGTPSGAIAATTTFLYSGSASSSSAATLISNRNIGNLAVQNGFLNINQSALTTGGGVTLSSGGLILNGTGLAGGANSAYAGTITLSAGKIFTMTGGTLVFDIGTAQDQILSLGSGSFAISGGTLSLSLGAGFDYGTAYTLFSGFTSGSVANLSITGYDTADYTATLSSAGVLTFAAAAVPEPSTWLLLLAGASLLVVAVRRRRFAFSL